MPKPSFIALQALVAVAEHGGVNRAAAALRVSPAAISQHLHQLNLILGHAVVENRRGKTCLTPRGLAYVDAIQPHFKAIDEHTQHFFPLSLPQIVRISTDSWINHYYLTSKISELRRLAPDIELQILAYRRLVNLDQQESDLAIRLSIDHTGDYEQHIMGHIDIVAVCKPDVLPDLAQLALIGFDFYQDAWAQWHRYQPCDVIGPERHPRHIVDDGFTALSLAAAGEGIALTFYDAAKPYLDQQSLLIVPRTKPVKLDLLLLNSAKIPLKPHAAQIKDLLLGLSLCS